MIISSPYGKAAFASTPTNDPCGNSWRNLHYNIINFLWCFIKNLLISRPTTCQQILEKKNNASRGERKGEANLINLSPRPKAYKSYHFICQPTLNYSVNWIPRRKGEKVVRKQLAEHKKVLNRSEQNKPHGWENSRGSCLWQWMSRRIPYKKDSWLVCHKWDHHC